MPWTVMGLELTRVLGRLGNSPSTVMCFLHWGAEEGQFGSGLQSSKEGGERGDVCSGGSDGGRDDGRDGSEVVPAMRTRPLPAYLLQGLLVETARLLLRSG